MIVKKRKNEKKNEKKKEKKKQTIFDGQKNEPPVNENETKRTHSNNQAFCHRQRIKNNFYIVNGKNQPAYSHLSHLK